MNYEKQIQRFLRRKAIVLILGADYQLTPIQRTRLCKLLDVHKTPKNMENMLATVANFIAYDLTNYVGRYRRLAGIGGTSKYTQMLRYGRHWEQVYAAQSQKKVKHFPNTLNYWMSKGFSISEARQKVSEVQMARGSLGAAKTRGTSRYTIRSVEYWINSGYSIEEAKNKVRHIQTTNGLEFYKRNYPDSFEEKFQERIEKWQESLRACDQKDLNLKKSPTVEGALARGLTPEQAFEVRQSNLEHLRRVRRLPSKISQKLFDLLERRLGDLCYYSDKNYEKLVGGYRVDFYHPASKIVVEFYGDFYHRNPKLFESAHTVFNKSAEEVWEYDKQREAAIRQDPKTRILIVVWESDFRKNPNQVIDNIIKEINS